MSWREELRRVRHPDGRELVGARFRGVSFFVAEGELRSGRRLVPHEFPGRSVPSIDDLGRRARVFQVQAYVIGDGYLAQKRALQDALDGQPGPGELVHPYYGTLRAICGPYTVRETARRGGIATFSIEFHEEPAEPPSPIEEPDLPEQVDASCTAAQAAIEEELVAEYDVAQQPSWALDSLQAGLESLSDGMDAALSPITRNTQELARLDAQLQTMTAQATSLVRQPREAIGALRDALASISATIQEAPRAILRALLDEAAAFGIPRAAGTTATREQERANQAALEAACRRVLIVEAARAIPRVDYETIEAARGDRERVVDAIDEQAETAGDISYPALVQLRADVLRAVPGDAQLARVLEIERRVAVPSLLISYQLYGSVDQEGDIVARNGVRHPAFVVGELEVLSHGE